VPTRPRFAPIEHISRARNQVTEEALAANAHAARPVSPWLYVAGLLATLSGFYAVNLSLDQPGYSVATCSLVAAGYAFSYCMRVRRLPWGYTLLAALAIIGSLALYGMYGDANWITENGLPADRARYIQVLLQWYAVIQSFVLVSDGMVLFQCVPCIPMLAFTSWTSTDPRAVWAFLLFACAATFLMVHENYLRTQATTVRSRAASVERNLFKGQLQLAGFCWVGAVVIACPMVVLLTTLGQKLFDPRILPISALMHQFRSNRLNPATIGEAYEITVGFGPGTESDLPVFRVRCDRPLYWRGTTFNGYTGHSFVNDPVERFEPGYPRFQPTVIRDDVSLGSGPLHQGDETPMVSVDGWAFDIPPASSDVPGDQMRGSRLVRQTFTMLSGMISQVYGADTVREVSASARRLTLGSDETIRAIDSGGGPQLYSVVSQVPSNDPAILRAADGPIPQDVSGSYLQAPGEFGAEVDATRALAMRLTRGCTNNYDRVIALKEYIAAQCRYNLQAAGVPAGHDVVYYFLMQSHEGYCDSFGAALTMLCRYVGIPARLASGFLTGDRVDQYTYLVREKHKHVWTEVYFPKAGWVPFDATEGTVDISNHQAVARKSRAGLLYWLGAQGAGPALLTAIVLSALMYVLKVEVWDRLRRVKRPLAAGAVWEQAPTNLEVVRCYGQGLKALSQWGVRRPPEFTPDEFAGYVAGLPSEPALAATAPLMDLTTLCTRFRYGPEVAGDEHVAAARAAFAALTGALSGVARPRR
jgi:hypothetical protein